MMKRFRARIARFLGIDTLRRDVTLLENRLVALHAEFEEAKTRILRQQHKIYECGCFARGFDLPDECPGHPKPNSPEGEKTNAPAPQTQKPS